MTKMYCILLTFIQISGSHARQHIVRDESGRWAVPNKSYDYDLWAGQQRFQVGDSLGKKSNLIHTFTDYLHNRSNGLSIH